MEGSEGWSAQECCFGGCQDDCCQGWRWRGGAGWIGGRGDLMGRTLRFSTLLRIGQPCHLRCCKIRLETARTRVHSQCMSTGSQSLKPCLSKAIDRKLEADPPRYMKSLDMRRTFLQCSSIHDNRDGNVGSAAAIWAILNSRLPPQLRCR